MDQKILEQKENGTLLRVKVKASSEKFEVGETNPWRNHLKIKVSSPAEKGKANRELLNELKSILDRDVEIISGRKSREKKLLIKKDLVEEVKKSLDL